jgi:hypothetical protein
MAGRSGWRQGARKQFVPGADIGRRARPLWRCVGCGLQHEATDPSGKRSKPVSCYSCGRMDFEFFHSRTEANRFAQLLLMEKAGEVSEVRRQVPFPLNAVAANGLVTKIGDYVADFVYRDKAGELVIEDRKGGDLIDPLADWKLRHMAAQGQPVIITKD